MGELLKYFKGDDLAASVWKGKYAIKGETTPRDMHIRMAKEFARVEEKYKSIGIAEHQFNAISDYGKHLESVNLDEEFIFNLFNGFESIVPQGSIMSMLGNPDKIGSLSNCFVVGQPHDSYGGIMQKDEQLSQLMKRRGGVGIDISTLRPNLTKVSNAAGSSTGAVSFMHRYSNTTREVAQNGRRGALMISIDIRHPDVMEFIKIKQDLTKVTGANVSVQLRDDFMEAVVNNKDYLLRFPCNQEVEDDFSDQEYNKLVYWANGVTKRVKAVEYFDELVKANWASAEPGSIFVDKHWNYSPDGIYPQYKGVTTNPCGEIFMQMYDACRLLALNFYSIVNNAFQTNANVDYKKLYELAYLQQRLSDDIVDLEIEHIDRILNKINSDKEPEEVKRVERELWENIRRVASSGRRTGCGFTALGDLLAALQLKYDSPSAKLVIEEVMKTKLRGELDCTIDLAITRGAFEGWNSDLEFTISDNTAIGKLFGNNAFYQMLCDDFPQQAWKMFKFGRRNVSWSTVAPTGTVSLLTQTTSGLEPLFMGYYMRRKKVNRDGEDRVDFVDQNGDCWMEYPVLHPKFREWLDVYCDENHMQRLNVDTMTKDEINSYFEISPWFGSTANDIDWIQRVEIQGIIQKYTTHSISSTINLPNDVSVETVNNIYLEAWKKGLKGVTIYRDGCRTGVLVADTTKKESFEYKDAPKRPKDLMCDIFSITAKGKKWNVICGLFDNKPYEVFAVPYFTAESSMVLRKLAKGRYDLITNGETYSEDITSEMTDEESALTRMISTALRHGSSIDFIVEQLNKSHGTVVSFSKAISRVLSKYAKNLRHGKLKCQDCGSENVIKEEGCEKCKECGSSKCG